MKANYAKNTMSTASLRKDHELIEKVLKAMNATIQLLESGKRVPEQILSQTVDFAKNFTDACHHAKEEEVLFPALERTGMPTKMGPIAVMLMEHRQARELAHNMETGMETYVQDNNPQALLDAMKQYVRHVTEHLWKENNRLFVMAEARLQNSSDVITNIDNVEHKQLNDMGKSRTYYENLVTDMNKRLSDV